MANPNYYCYCFLIMISPVVLLIAPIGAGDDDGGSLLGGKKLIIGLPYEPGHTQFVNVVQIDPTNNNQVIHVRGYSIDVFNDAIAYLRLHHNVSFEFRAFADPSGGSSAGYYDAFVSQLSEKYDAVVGDVTILASQSNYADFTLPYKLANVQMLVKIHDPRLNMWSFVRPFSWNLWLSIAMFSAFIGAIILFMERNVRKDSTLENSSWRKRCITGGSVLWLPAVQAVFPKRESLTKTSSRFVLMMWLILVFVLMQSYTACLSSILIVHELQPQYLSENDVIKDSNINVGYKSGSFVGDLLVNKLTMGDESRVKNYYGIEEYKEALDKGSHNDGVDAIFDESPYFKTFLHRYGSKNYAVVGTSLHYGGFGFAFRKGSNLTAYFSEAILNITESNVIMKRIEETYFGDSDDDDGKEDLYNSPSHDVSPSLTAHSFAGLFVVIGILSLLALLVSEMLAKVDSQRLLSLSSARLSPLEEGSETRNNVDEECSADTQNIGSENGGDNKTLPV